MGFKVQPCRWPIGQFDPGGNFLEDERPTSNVQHPTSNKRKKSNIDYPASSTYPVSNFKSQISTRISFIDPVKNILLPQNIPFPPVKTSYIKWQEPEVIIVENVREPDSLGEDRCHDEHIQALLFLIHPFNKAVYEKTVQVIPYRPYPGKRPVQSPVPFTPRKTARPGVFLPGRMRILSYACALAASAGAAASPDLYFLKAFQPS